MYKLIIYKELYVEQAYRTIRLFKSFELPFVPTADIILKENDIDRNNSYSFIFIRLIDKDNEKLEIIYNIEKDLFECTFNEAIKNYSIDFDINKEHINKERFEDWLETQIDYLIQREGWTLEKEF